MSDITPGGTLIINIYKKEKDNIFIFLSGILPYIAIHVPVLTICVVDASLLVLSLHHSSYQSLVLLVHGSEMKYKMPYHIE
jgi:hypothetical protein